MGLKKTIALLALLPILPLVWPLPDGRAADAPREASVSVPEPARVAVVSVRPVPRQVAAYGVVHAQAQSVLSSKVQARVVALPFREGDPIKRGDLLAELDHADLDAELAAARAAVDRAEAALKEAEAEHARIKGLRSQGSATIREMDRAVNNLSQARGARSEALAHRQLVTARLDHSRITAPFDGRFVERLVEVGEMATPGLPLVRVVSTGAPELWADVPQSEVGYLSPGQLATVFVDGTGFAGKVARIVPAADPRSHTFTVKVALDEGGGIERVFAGMFGRVEIPYANVPRLVVPVGAVVRRSEVAGVYVARPEGDVPEFRLVRPGPRIGDFQVIESGLSRGEMVWVDAAQAARVRAEAGGR